MGKTMEKMEIIDSNFGDNAQMQKICEGETIKAHVAQVIYDLRSSAGLSQKELADLIGTTCSVISRLEDGKYEGNYLPMLNCIAGALNFEVKIEIVPNQS